MIILFHSKLFHRTSSFSRRKSKPRTRFLQLERGFFTTGKTCFA